MPRARNLKPGFFANEDLAECSPWARLCFAGLWTLADREGRLEDRPKRIKGELFRFDTVDVEPLLVELERFGFVERYQIDGERFIQVSKFLDHQTPHYSEKPSVIKPPPLREIREHIDDKNSKTTPRVAASSRWGRNPLNPESRILTPDSPNPDSRTPTADKLGTVVGAGATAADAAATTDKPERGTRLPKDWQLPKAWGEWALAKYPQWTADKVRDEALKFRNHWTALTGKAATKLDWQATWQNWCMSDIAHRDDPKANGAVNRQLAVEAENRRVLSEWLGTQPQENPQ